MSEIVIYNSGESAPSLFVQVDKGSVWLTLDQITGLFQRNKSTISRHIQNVFNDGELDERVVVAKKMQQLQQDSLLAATTMMIFKPKLEEKAATIALVMNFLTMKRGNNE